MGTKLTVVDNMTQAIEGEQFSETNLQNSSLEELFEAFGMIFDENEMYTNRYLNCCVVREKLGFSTFKFEFC